MRVVVALLAVSFALLVLVGSSQLTTVLITGVTGLLSFVVAGGSQGCSIETGSVL